MWYLIDFAFFFEPPFAAVGDFFVTFVDVLASEDVDLVLGAVALALGGACVDGTADAAAGFFVKSAFYFSEKKESINHLGRRTN